MGGEGGVRTSQIKRGGLECGVCERTRGRGELRWENEGDGSVHSLALSRRETKDAESHLLTALVLARLPH